MTHYNSKVAECKSRQMASKLVGVDASGIFSLIIPFHFCCCLDSKILSCCGLRGIAQSSASQTSRCMCTFSGILENVNSNHVGGA